MITLPNIITFIRIALIPVFIIVYYLSEGPSFFWAAFVFWFAGVSDALDGYLARKLDQSTPFGAFLDPVADKVMVAAGMFVIVEHYQSLWVTIPAICILSREIVMSALRPSTSLLRQMWAMRSSRSSLRVTSGSKACASLIRSLRAASWAAN